MAQREAIIIGSGLGGLSTGVMLARMGWHVTVLEQHTVAGGCLQSFCRRGARFETGMHFVGSLDHGQVLQPIAHFLGLDQDVQYGRLDTDGYNVVSLAGQRFHIPNGHDAFVDSLGSQLGGHRDELDAYHRLVHQVASNTPISTLGAGNTDQSLFTHYQMQAVDDVLEQVVRAPLLQRILVGHLSLYQGRRGCTPFVLHAFITDFYDASAFRIVGGANAMVRAMVRVIENHGGTVLVNHRVQQIVVRDGRAAGVVAADREFAADVVVSTLHPASTLALVPSTPPILRPAYRSRVQQIPNTTGIFAVYLHFRPGEVPYMNHNFYSYADGNPWGCEDYTTHDWPRGYLYMHHQDEPHQKWARTGVLLSYMNYSDVARWAGTRVGQRGADYETFKAERERLLLDAVERDFPGLRAHLLHTYTSTPLTYESYTSTPQGCIYGTFKDVNTLAQCHVSHITRLPGLYMAGQSINSHGMLGTVVGSITACAAIVGEAELYTAIRKDNGL